MGRNVLTMRLSIRNHDGQESAVLFDSGTLKTDIAGPVYPSDLRLISELVQRIKEANRFHPNKHDEVEKPA